jgi:hypothetical protein
VSAPDDHPGRSACPDMRTLVDSRAALERTAGVRAPCTSTRDRRPGYSSGVTSGVDAWRSWLAAGWTGNGHGRRVRLSTPWRERCSARPWTAMDMTARGRRWRSWTWLSGAGPQRTLPSGRPAASRHCGPQREPAAVRLDSEGGQRTRAWRQRRGRPVLIRGRTSVAAASSHHQAKTSIACGRKTGTATRGRSARRRS